MYYNQNYVIRIYLKYNTLVDDFYKRINFKNGQDYKTIYIIKTILLELSEDTDKNTDKNNNGNDQTSKIYN